MKRRFKIYLIVLGCALVASYCFVAIRATLQEDSRTLTRPNGPNRPLSTSASATKASKTQGGQRTIDSSINKAPSSKITITGNGTIPSDIARNLGLDLEKTTAIQGEIGRFWKEMEVATTARAWYDAVASDENLKRDVYRIPALADGGVSVKDGLLKRMSAIVGDENASTLISGMNQKPFGGFGKYDVKLTFVPDEDEASKGETRVTYEYTDPKSGNLVFRGTSTLQSFSENFGPWSAPD